MLSPDPIWNRFQIKIDWNSTFDSGSLAESVLSTTKVFVSVDLSGPCRALALFQMTLKHSGALIFFPTKNYMSRDKIANCYTILFSTNEEMKTPITFLFRLMKFVMNFVFRSGLAWCGTYEYLYVVEQITYLCQWWTQKSKSGFTIMCT